MKKIMSLFGVLLMVSTAQAVVMEDNFNRTDGSLGARWETLSGGHEISGGKVNPTSGDSLVVYNQADTLNDGAGKEFAISVDASLSSTESGYVGLAFNVQDAGNYYCVRFKENGSIQGLRYVDGLYAGMYFNRAAETFTYTADQVVKISVTSTNAYSFLITLTDKDSGDELFSINAVDSQSKFSDGLGGIFSSSGVGTYDNFSLDVVPSPETTGFVEDDFNRSDGGIGTDWITLSGGYELSGGKVSPTSRDSLVVYNQFDTSNDGEGKEFTISVEASLSAAETNGFVGLAVNVQNATNFYGVRFNGKGGIQGVRYVDGSVSTFFTRSDGTLTYTPDQVIKMTIASTDAYVLSVTLTDQASGEELFFINATDSQNRFTDGSGGILSTSGVGTYDNFSLQVLPAPVFLEGFDLWADGWGVELGGMTADYDGDFLSNLAEYALGGDPTSALDRGVAPTFGFDGTDMVYLYPQRSDDAALTYTVKTTDNLVSGVWTNAAASVVGTNVTGSTFDYVTNTVPATDTRRFLKLEVQQN
jgi:hypothetical protein